MKMQGLRLCLWSTFFVIHNVLGLFSYMAFFAIIFIIKPFHPKLFWKLEGFMYQQINRLNAVWLWEGGFNIYESGDDVSHLADNSCVVFANHQNTCDVPSLLAWLATKAGVSSRVLWVMDVMFKCSHFGMVSTCHHDFFIQSGRAARDESLQKFRTHLKEYYRPPLDRKWILLYPEGGFLYKQKEKNHAYARKNDLPIFHHVGLPRIGAMKVIMNSVGRKLEYIIDVTMAYNEEEDLNFWRMFIPKRPFDISVYIRVFPASEVPIDDDKGLLNWMIDRWTEKEKRMKHFQEHKIFPVLPEDERYRVSSVPLIRSPRRVQLLTVSRFAVPMFFTLVPGFIALCVLGVGLWTAVPKLWSSSV